MVLNLNVGLLESEIRHFEEPPYTKKFYKAKNFELILSLSMIKEIVKSKKKKKSRRKFYANDVFYIN